MKHLKIYFTLFLLTGFVIIGFSQDLSKGQITGNMLKQIKSSIQDDGLVKVLTNAVANNNIQDLVVNRENVGKIDPFFKYRVKTKGITDQQSSGRCWLFTGLNVLRPKVIGKYNLSEFEFSQTYCFFWDQLEKSNLFLEAIIATSDKQLNSRKVEWLFKHPIGDGGQWTGVVNIVEKYGVVPVTVMPETNSSSNTRMMSKLIRRKLREYGLELREIYNKENNIEALHNRKVEMLSVIYRMLVITLGPPPEKFEWRYKDANGTISEVKEFTPLSFYKEAVGVNLQDYVMIMNDPSRPYYKLYEIEYDRHMHNGLNWKYINLPNREIKEFAKLSIMDNEAMYYSCDVGKQLARKKGYLDINYYDYKSLFGIEFNMDKKQRIQTFESASTHGMALVAVDVDEKERPTKWLLENSWGASSGYKGHLIMTNEWFNEYMFRIVINRKYISEKVLIILNQKPIMLPPWDPMFTPEK